MESELELSPGVPPTFSTGPPVDAPEVEDAVASDADCIEVPSLPPSDPDPELESELEPEVESEPAPKPDVESEVEPEPMMIDPTSSISPLEPVTTRPSRTRSSRTHGKRGAT